MTNVTLIGNPNVGKSSIFNSLTGLKQHTGNWTGKTVELCQGFYSYGEEQYALTDLPGTYSLFAHSPEERVASEYILSTEADVAVVVCDSTCLVRSLSLALQVMELRKKVVICFNLIDSAKKQNIKIDIQAARELLGVPIVLTNARSGRTLEELKSAIAAEASKTYTGKGRKIISYKENVDRAVDALCPTLVSLGVNESCTRGISAMLLSSYRTESLSYLCDILRVDYKLVEGSIADVCNQLFTKSQIQNTFSDELIAASVKTSETICEKIVSRQTTKAALNRMDRILTGRWTAFPIMIIMLFCFLYITVRLANYPSMLLSAALSYLGGALRNALVLIKTPEVLISFFCDGVYATTSAVISVMLPPMAIFFPLFTLLEDIGLLPRIAYNLDAPFCYVGASGKQSLTMCMGLGCNAAGITGCRIIDSERERHMAIITNSLIPCNGKFPSVLLLVGLLFSAVSSGTLVVSIGLLFAVILGVVATFGATFFLSKTFYKGKTSFFTLELPSYRVPNVPRVLVRSFLDRTLKILLRALCVAVPAGALIWVLSTVSVSGASLFSHFASLLEPIGKIMGLDGVLLASFILGTPANEIVLPIAIMGYTSGNVAESLALSDLSGVLASVGWGPIKALSAVIFFLFHWPCSTSLITVYKETRSIKALLLSFFVPSMLGFLLCVLINGISLLLPLPL